MKKLLVSTVLGLAMIIGSATMAFAASTTGVPSDAFYPGSTINTITTTNTVDVQLDNNIGNANETGKNVNSQQKAGDVIKSDGMNLKWDTTANNGAGGWVTGDVTQRTHGEYQNNTNSCASCHQTHTGAADNLLFKSSIYDTCTACHDGTLGFYNVFAPSTAGTFGGTQAGNASIHMANGTMEVKAAPGGNKNVATNGTSGTDALGEATWTGEFTCASCHSPHGSYSSRLLNFNPNGIASVPMVDTDGTYTGTTGAATGGQMVRDTVQATLPVTVDENSPAYVVLQAKADTVLDASIIANGKMGVTSANTVVVVMKKTGDGHATPYSYVRDTNPWIFGGEYKEDHSYKVNFTKFYPAAAVADLKVDEVTADGLGYDPQITKGITFNYQQAFAKLTSAMTDGNLPGTLSGATNPANTYTTLVGQQADISRAFVVNLKMDDSNFEWFGAANSGVKITQVSPANYSDAGQGVAVSTFCAACHTDYLTGSSNDQPGTGVWSKAFRHSTNSDSYTCLKCHFAHGTDVTVMMDANDRSITGTGANSAKALFGGDVDKATAYLLDRNPSSALKRYTNMSVCWKCHTSSHSVGTMNNNYVNNVKYDADTLNDLSPKFNAPANNALPYFKATVDVVTP